MPNPHTGIPPARKPGVPQPGDSPPGARPPAPGRVSGEGDWERITPATRAQVWKKRFGFRSTGTCVCCHEKTIRRDDFACGHRRAYAAGGNDVSNLEPVCARCNELMGTHDLVPWCKKFQESLKTVKPMPKTTTAKKPVRKAAAKKPAAKAAAKKPVRKAAAKKPVAKAAAVKKPVRKTAPKKPAPKKAKR
jgi:hypothetical protein